MPLIVGGALALTGTIVNGVRSNNERKRQQKKLDQLSSTPRPRFGVTPELRGFYNQASSEANNPDGFSGAEESAFQQRLGQNYNTQYNNAVSRSGGQTGSFVNNVLSSQNVNAINDFAAADANLERQNRQSALGRQYGAIGQIQNIDNMNNQADLNYRLSTEQALGASIAQQKQNLSGLWSDIAGIGGTVAGYGLNKRMYKPEPTPKPQKWNSQITDMAYTGPNQGNPWAFNDLEAQPVQMYAPPSGYGFTEFNSPQDRIGGVPEYDEYGNVNFF